MQETLNYIEQNKERFRDELYSLLRIPSISAKPEHRDDMYACANRWCELLVAAGADSAQLMETGFNPVVYGEKIINPEWPTVIVYGHYDVMPAEPLELWNSDPFEPEVRDGRLWGRGTDDDKGQAFIQVKAFEIALKRNMLHCNVKFLFEGGEEVGSPGLEEFCANNRELLKGDVILVSDTSMVGREHPSLTTGLRGLAYWEIEVTGPCRDLHSGHFGGAVANPINVLCKMLAGITDADGRITIPHFYDDAEELSPEERAMMAAVPYDEKAYCDAIGVKALAGEKGYSTIERAASRPTFDICGIWGGYTGEGSKTVLPSKAHAKVSCRLIPNQDYHKITQQFIDYIADIAPETVQVKVTPMQGSESYVCPIGIPAYKAAEKGFALAFGQQPLAVRRGGSIGVIPIFERVLGLKSVLMGFGLEKNAIHSPNESFALEMYERGIVAVVEFYNQYKG